MFEKLIPIINRADKIAIVTHSHPDGDAMGSSYSMKLALEKIGKQCKVFLLDEPDAAAYSLVIKGDETEFLISESDLVIALDSADSKRLGKYETEFLDHPCTIAIDHHITHIAYAKSGTVFTNISSTCELVYMLYKEMGIEIDKDIATNVYVGLATDTGHFKYSSVTGDTMRTAGELIDIGVDFACIAKRVFDTKSKAYYRLMETALNKLVFLCDGRAAALFLSEKDFENADIKESEANGIVTIPGSIEGVEVGIFIRERGDDEYKISLRSSKYIDVSEIAAGFGGGGHIRASGYCSSGKTVTEIIEDLIKELDKRWQD